MANVPVDSMRTGGLFWFTDLTLPDPYYLLPILTSATMWLTIEVWLIINFTPFFFFRRAQLFNRFLRNVVHVATDP